MKILKSLYQITLTYISQNNLTKQTNVLKYLLHLGYTAMHSQNQTSYLIH